jgi:dTDP-4-amino-4,6-dideoxygalactose transaminase
MQKLLDNGISSRRGVMTSHRETAYRDEYKNIRLPVSEDACDRSILIPIYIPMEEQDIEHIISSLKHMLK